MLLFGRFRSRVLIAIAVSIVLSIAVYAYTAANTVPASKAGDGAGAISGYTISNIGYNLNGLNPQNIDSVTFNVDTTSAAGSTMEIKLVAAGSDWYSCTNITTALTCITTAPQATVTTADELRVVIAD